MVNGLEKTTNVLASHLVVGYATHLVMLVLNTLTFIGGRDLRSLSITVSRKVKRIVLPARGMASFGRLLLLGVSHFVVLR